MFSCGFGGWFWFLDILLVRFWSTFGGDGEGGVGGRVISIGLGLLSGQRFRGWHWVLVCS